MKTLKDTNNENGYYERGIFIKNSLLSFGKFSSQSITSIFSIEFELDSECSGIYLGCGKTTYFITFELVFQQDESQNGN